MADLQKLPKADRASQVGCTSKASPVESSLFGGIRLGDLMNRLGIGSVAHCKLVFHALDGEVVEIDEGYVVHDILIAFEENGAPLSQGRGFPLRVIIPGKRVVKWVNRIEIR